MNGTASWIIGGIIATLGLGGLFLASGARDDGMYLFGLGLFGFAVLFVFRLIGAGFDAAERTAASTSARPDAPAPAASESLKSAA